jgi:hypothetical protein
MFDHLNGPVPTDPAAVRAEIEAAAGRDDLAGIHEVSGRLFVSLPLGREQIADALVARHGDLVRVDVGGIPWPLDDVDAMFAGCADPLPGGDAIDGLSAEVTPTHDEVEVGENVTGTVVLTNATREPVTFGWGGAGVRGYLVQPGSDRPVGMYVGAETMQFVSTPAPAGGASKPVPVLAGAASCNPRIHTAVPPGPYDLVAVLHLEDGRTVRSARAAIVVSTP